MSLGRGYTTRGGYPRQYHGWLHDWLTGAADWGITVRLRRWPRWMGGYAG